MVTQMSNKKFQAVYRFQRQIPIRTLYKFSTTALGRTSFVQIIWVNFSSVHSKMKTYIVFALSTVALVVVSFTNAEDNKGNDDASERDDRSSDNERE